MKFVKPTSSPTPETAPDGHQRWLALGLVTLALMGIVTVFGSTLWAVVTGDVSIQNP